MSEVFTEKLHVLQQTYMKMGINVSDHIYKSIKAFTENNRTLAKEIIKADSAVNNEEVDLEKEALSLIALRQPVASNFRSIITLLKASSDLERIGDHAVSIARETLRIDTNTRIAVVDEAIKQMSVKVRGMLESSLDAYVHQDSEAARLVAQEDLLIDKKFVIAKNLIVESMEKNSDTIEIAAVYLMIVRLLERIGDHIVNLSEWIVYNSTGKIIELNPGKIEPELIAKELKRNQHYDHHES